MPDDFAGGQSGDEGTQLASPCLSDNNAAFLARLTQLTAGHARVDITAALTPAAERMLEALAGELEGCATGYFTTEMPSPGEDVLVVLVHQEDMTPARSLALVGLLDDQVNFSSGLPTPILSVDELLDPACLARWNEANASTSSSAGAPSIGETPADCGRE